MKMHLKTADPIIHLCRIFSFTIHRNRATKQSLQLQAHVNHFPAEKSKTGVTMAPSFLFGWHKKRRQDKSKLQQKEQRLFLNEDIYKDLFKATDGFSTTNLIGVGSFGSVYKATIAGEVVAVKVLKNHRQGASKSFMAEYEILRSIRHRNLVKLKTACSTIDLQGNGFKALIYEFMPHGNLGRWLHLSPGSNISPALNLHQRINIAIDVACALEYLHYYCPMLVIHCDLKPSNILLDEDMVAHVGDFGLAKYLPELPNLNQRNSIRTRGTTGYAAPEYGRGSEVSTKGDIYSYGILLLEMMTGKKPTECMFEDGLDHHSFARVALPGIVLLEVLTGKRPILEDDFDLHSFARKALPNRVMEIVDPILLKDIEEHSLVGCLISMVRIGVACSMESPQDRMEIRKVIRELKLIRDILQGTQKRPTRKRPMLSLRMTWLPSFEKSYCQDEPNSYSQGESCLPSVENSYSQGESGLPNFEESYSQGELWLSNFEKSYISSNGQETLSQTQNLFPNPVPSLPKLIQYKGPGWESFEECYCQDEPKSDNQGETRLPNFENCFNQEESWLPNSRNSFSQEESWLPKL